MSISRRALIGSAAAVTAVRPGRAQAGRLKLGVLNDMSGPYRDVTGPTALACTRQAVEDFAASRGLEVEVIGGDHLNKPDVGVYIVREWFDRGGVDVVIDVPTSSVALAVNSVVREKNKVYLNSGGATGDLTGAQCSPNTIKWSYDTYLLARSTGGAAVAAGGDSWFFITANYVFGQQLQRDTTAIVTKAGGRVLGAAPYPFPETTDFSSYLLAAKASGAKVIGFANAGDDVVNCVKQAHEFGMGTGKGGPMLAGLLLSITGAHALGTEVGQGLLLSEAFYWDLNDRTRAFTRRVLPKTPNNYPNAVQAGCYSATIHYLKAVADMGVAAAKADGAAVVSRMKAMPFDDDAYGTGRIREDGRALVAAYLFQVKSPAESTGPWDLYKHIGTTPGEDAALPLAEGKCPLVRA